MDTPLPPQRAAVLAFLRGELTAGRAPSLAEIAHAFGFSSRNAAQKHVQALVDAGSAQAPVVLRALIAYLRAAVPRLHEASTTLGEEVDLVRAYLELMHMR